MPTNAPTLIPTLYPTSVPTYSPSDEPSQPPTNGPTASPSIVPSAYPSAIPSQAPSMSPSGTPSQSPTVIPTHNPSAFPTAVPTRIPTMIPSRTPTSAPLATPTDFPSGTPSNAPSNFPSTVPSNMPTTSPSNAPTSLPSRTPSFFPTLSPSSTPTKAPSLIPTSAPTRTPTTFPTYSPTSSPTDDPFHTCAELMGSTYSLLENGTFNISVVSLDRWRDFPVYCIFDYNNTLYPNASIAWTLFESGNLSMYQDDNYLQIPWSQNRTFNQESPNDSKNSLYRMSREAMIEIKNFSDFMFSTCNFDLSLKQDFFWFDINDLETTVGTDIFGYFGSVCLKAREIDVRNESCKFQTVNVVSNSTFEHFHVLSGSTNCECDLSNGAITNENNFGEYSNYNSEFSCSSGLQSTTQWWFGAWVQVPDPTTEPTNAPTSFPTKIPTQSPNQPPTNAPTVAPSRMPTASPTKFPTQFPSTFPSNVPSQPPTQAPSIPPTAVPTHFPSDIPSRSPSVVPTIVPTAVPSVAPIRTPSIAPSITPTNSPSVPPTSSPSVAPTSLPTRVPTTVPTQYPTRQPSVSPTNTPSQPPTRFPTENPSIGPTNSPSQPPTAAPSDIPSAVPTGSPSQPPTAIPTAVPTQSPTANPTPPTESPTAEPINVVVTQTEDDDGEENVVSYQMIQSNDISVSVNYITSYDDDVFNPGYKITLESNIEITLDSPGKQALFEAWLDKDVDFNVSLNWDVTDSSGNSINSSLISSGLTRYNEFTGRLIQDEFTTNISYYYIDSYYVIYSDKSSYSRYSGLSLCDALDESIFTMGKTYYFKNTIDIVRNYTNVEYYETNNDEISLKANRKPSGGNCGVSPNIGLPLTDIFNFTCYDWVDKDKRDGVSDTIEYNFVKQDTNTFLNTFYSETIKFAEARFGIGYYNVSAIIIDEYNLAECVSMTVQVTKNITQLTESVENFTNWLSNTYEDILDEII